VPPRDRPAPGAPKPPVVALSVKEAIARALRNNPDLSIQRFQVAIAAAGIDLARGDFDPRLFSDAAYGKRRDPFFSVNPLGTTAVPGVPTNVNLFTGLPPGLVVNPSDAYTYDAGVRQLTQLGTRYEVRYDNSRRTTGNEFALSPAWNPIASVAITQPLLRGLGIDVNRAFITVAAEGHQVSREALRDIAMTTAFAVEQAYWGYVFAVENRKVAEQAVRTAEDTLKVARGMVAAGKFAPIEILVAETGVASRQEAVIVAESEVLNARDRLLRLTEPPGSAAQWDVELLPLDAPRIDESAIDATRAFETALEHRPDLASLGHNVAADRARLLRAENDKLPRLDVIGSFNDQGYGPTIHFSHGNMLDGGFYDFSIGLGFEFPIFNTAATAAVEQAELAIRQDRKRIESLEQSIVLDVRTAVRDVLAARERIRAAEKAADLSARQLEEQRKRLAVGLVTNHDVLLFETDLTQARTNALKARTDYEISRGRLARVTGMSLERRDIHIEEVQ
jgi:outer membrane protein TolC